MFLTNEQLVIIGVFVGVSIRTLLPYFAKYKADPSITFEWKYLVTAAITVIESAVLTVLLVTAIPPELLASTASAVFIFASAFSWSYSSNDIFNRIVSSKADVIVVTEAKAA